MKHGRRTVSVLAAAACLVVGGAIGSGLLNAAAATSGSKAKGSATTAHTSNEDPAHEAGESAAREAAEDNGTATFGGPGGHGHRGGSNEDPAHEQSESAEREAEESAGATQPSAPSTGSSTTTTPAN